MIERLTVATTLLSVPLGLDLLNLAAAQARFSLAHIPEFRGWWGGHCHDAVFVERVHRRKGEGTPSTWSAES